jgi:hypothetical protein
MTIAGQRFGKHVPAATNRRGINTCCYEDRSSTRRLSVTADSQQVFSMATSKQQKFSMVTGSLHKEPCREERVSRNSDVREFSAQLRSVNQRTTEAEEITGS